MSARVRSLSTLYAPLLQGTPRPRRRPWRWVGLVLGLAALIGVMRSCERQAKPATGTGSACDFDGECPPALVCTKGKCAPSAEGEDDVSGE